MKPTLYKCLMAAALVSMVAPSTLAAPVPVVAAVHDPYYDLIVDDARQQLYASVDAGDSIDVLALPDLNLITSIPVGAGLAGLDLAPSGDEPGCLPRLGPLPSLSPLSPLAGFAAHGPPPPPSVL